MKNPNIKEIARRWLVIVLFVALGVLAQERSAQPEPGAANAE